MAVSQDFTYAAIGSLSTSNTAYLSTGSEWEIVVLYVFAVGATVAGVSDTASLTWQRRGGGTNGSNHLEVWWALSPGQLTNDGITVTFSGSPSVTQIFPTAWTGVNLITPWDANGALPRVTTGSGPNYGDTGAGNDLNAVIQSGISTTSAETAILNFFAGPSLILGDAVLSEWAFLPGNPVWQIGGGFGVNDGINPSGQLQVQMTGAPQSGIEAYQDGGTDNVPAPTPWIMLSDALVASAPGVVVGYFTPAENTDIFFGTNWAAIDTPTLEENPEALEFAVTAGGAASPTPTPFFFAWVDASQSAWTYAMARWDEKIIDMELKHEEGQIPTLDITIKNPRIGLLAPGRYQWAWFAYQSPNQFLPIPLFFGELVGVPTNLFAETITLKFIARSMDYIALKQAIAETLKIPGNYDPIFLDESHRDDPDAILEGWSSMYHVDRTTLAVSASDVLEGEDGTITFLPPAGKLGSEFVLYDSVNLSLGEAPLTNVQVEASVHWTQRSQGYVDGPDVNVQTYTGDTFVGDWPKPGKSLGGGWTVETSFVNDVYKVALTPNYSESSTSTFYQNSGREYDCDTASISSSISGPALLTPSSLAGTIILSWQVGFCEPGSSGGTNASGFSSRQPVNTPASVHGTGVVVPLWVLNCSWNLRYNAKREYTEDVTLNITANTQSVLTSPTVEQDTKLIKVTGEVGQPLIIYDAWTDFADKPVGRGQLIFPNDPTTPGGLAYQACVTAGTCGTTEPVFSDIPGTLTDDNGVVWASLGESPLSAIQNMTFATQYDIGTILLYQAQTFDYNIGELVDVAGATSYWLVTEPNTATTSTYTEYTYVPPVTSSDEPTPAPVSVFVEQFSPPAGMILLGTQPAFLGIPVGGTANNVTANNYFPTPRGRQSVEYLVNKARAQLRWRSRAVKISFDCSFDFLAQMNPSCRKNATVYDPRLPGGVATGKIISYGFTAKDGEMLGHVEIGCAVGYGGSISAITGTPVYASAGYVQSGYQQMEGGVYTLSEEDIGYTPPDYAPFDDGLIFPLQQLPCDGGVFSGTSGCPGPGQILAQVVNPGDMGGNGPPPVIDPQVPENLSGQAAAIFTGIVTDLLLLAYSTPVTPAVQQESGTSGVITTTTGTDATEAWNIANAYFNDTMQNLPYVMEANPITWEIEIDPVTNGPFSGAYTVICTELEVPQGINLNAPSFDE